MDQLSDLLKRYQNEILMLVESNGTPFAKAGVMSELVFALLDEIAKWPNEQQRQAIESIQHWLRGDNVPEIPLLHDGCIEKSMKLILRAVVDKFL
ncbi:MAG: hypothetical protein R2867_17400 [Caldilineaceae bacterium]